MCWNWRQALFQSDFWKNIVFQLGDPDRLFWTSYLSNSFRHSVENITVRCQLPSNTQELDCLLKKFGDNTTIKQLIIECKLSVDKSLTDFETLRNSIYCSILKIIKTSKDLQVLKLDGIHGLERKAAEIVDVLRKYHAQHLSILVLASTNREPIMYNPINLTKIFTKLKIITLDYEFLNDSLLGGITPILTLQRLNINVHKSPEDHPATTDDAWEIFAERVKCRDPPCELRVNFLRDSLDLDQTYERVLQPSMPLTHFKALFCLCGNIRVLHQLYWWYEKTIKSVIWIDSMNLNKFKPGTKFDAYFTLNDVFSNFRVYEMREFVFIGHVYTPELEFAILGKYDELSIYHLTRILTNKSECPYDLDDIRKHVEARMKSEWRFLDAKFIPMLLNALAGDTHALISSFTSKDIHLKLTYPR